MRKKRNDFDAVGAERMTDAELSKKLGGYTRALFDATPTLDGEKHKLNIIKGFSPDPIHLPGGCAFHPRCKEVCDKCSAVMPEMVEVAPGHLVRCVHAVPCGAEKTEEVAE